MDNHEEFQDEIKKEVLDSGTDEENIKMDKKFNLLDDKKYNAFEESIDDMDFLEASKKLKDITGEVEQFQDIKLMLASIESNTTGSSFGLDIEISNMLDSIKTDVDIKTFIDNYDDIMIRLNTLKNRLEEKVKEFDDIPKTSSYLTQSVLKSIAKKEKIIDENKLPSSLPFVVYYRTLKDVYENRNKTEFLYRKLQSQKANIARTKRDMKKSKNWIVYAQASIVENLKENFNETKIEIIKNYIEELFQDTTSSLLFLYTLSTIYGRTKKFNNRGEYCWILILFMNILDIYAGIYDIEGGSEEFNKELLKLKEFF